MEDQKKCSHAACTCTAAPLADHCCASCKDSDERAQAGETPMAECHCQHPNCGGTT
jgi:hypothetical protein